MLWPIVILTGNSLNIHNGTAVLSHWFMPMHRCIRSVCSPYHSNLTFIASLDTVQRFEECMDRSSVVCLQTLNRCRGVHLLWLPRFHTGMRMNALWGVRYSVVKFHVTFVQQSKNNASPSECTKHTERLDKIYFLCYNERSCIKTHTNSILTKSARCSCICLITRYKLSPNILCLVGVLILLPFYYNTFFLDCQPDIRNFLQKNSSLIILIGDDLLYQLFWKEKMCN